MWVKENIVTDFELWKKSVKAEKRDRNAEREKETFRRQRHQTDDGVDAETSFSLSLSAFLSLFSAFTLFFQSSKSVTIFSLKMRVSSKELFSTLKYVGQRALVVVVQNGRQSWRSFRNVLRSASFFILISAFAICTGPGTYCHPHSLLLSQFRSRIR